MKAGAGVIPLFNLLLCAIPLGMVAWIYFRWSLGVKGLLYAASRMVGQLLAVGFVLSYLFAQERPELNLLILVFMLAVAAWISLHSVKAIRRRDFGLAFLSLSVGAAPILGLVVFGVLRAHPWYRTEILIPIAGMIFANAMNAVSLAAERFHRELDRHTDWKLARAEALKTSLIPITNSFLAVGLVSLPGMMTGQILSGVSPLVAVRYQIMILAVVLGACGLSAACYLSLTAKRLEVANNGQIQSN